MAGITWRPTSNEELRKFCYIINDKFDIHCVIMARPYPVVTVTKNTINNPQKYPYPMASTAGGYCGWSNTGEYMHIGTPYSALAYPLAEALIRIKALGANVDIDVPDDKDFEVVINEVNY